MQPPSDINSAESPNSQLRLRKLRRCRSVQVNFRVSSKWLQIVHMLAKLEGRPASALMRELLTLGLAQYVNIYYRTPQLVREQQLKSIFGSQLGKAAFEAKAKASRTKRCLDFAIHYRTRGVSRYFDAARGWWGRREGISVQSMRSKHPESLIHVSTSHGMRASGLTTLVVDRSQVTLVKETKDLLEQLLETLDVMADRKLLRDIEVSKSQAAKGKTRSFRRLMGELGIEPQVHNRSHPKVRKKLQKA